MMSCDNVILHLLWRCTDNRIGKIWASDIANYGPNYSVSAIGILELYQY